MPHDLMPELVRHDCWYKTEKIGEEEHTKVASATGPTPYPYHRALSNSMLAASSQPALRRRGQGITKLRIFELEMVHLLSRWG
jgi:hypothetical protein